MVEATHAEVVRHLLQSSLERLAALHQVLQPYVLIKLSRQSEPGEHAYLDIPNAGEPNPQEFEEFRLGRR